MVDNTGKEKMTSIPVACYHYRCELSFQDIPAEQSRGNSGGSEVKKKKATTHLDKSLNLA